MEVKVISGGQGGTDVASLRAAKRVGFPTGGTMAKGWTTTTGAKPEYAGLFGMVECEEAGYPARTRQNVKDGGVTIFIGTDTESPGAKCTRKAIRDMRKNSFWISLNGDTGMNFLDPKLYPGAVRTLVLYLCDCISVGVDTVNFAGNRSESLEGAVESFLFDVFTELKKV